MKWIKNKIVIAIVTAGLAAGLTTFGVPPQWSQPIMAFVSAAANNILESIPLKTDQAPAEPEQK